MEPSAATTVYLLLGIPESGRREVLRDLITSGFPSGTPLAVLLPASEDPLPLDQDLQNLPGVLLTRGDQPPPEQDDAFASCEALFALIPGHDNPVDHMEEWKDWLYPRRRSFELGRILTLLHCALLQQNPGARLWYDACIHFSDAVLLNHRQEAGNKWVSDFQREQKKRHPPYLIEMVKKGAVANPARILEPQPRRLSQAFDFWAFESEELPGDLDIEIGGDPPPSEEEEDPIPEDPYFARMPGGRRLKKIPDIRRFLS